MNVVIKELGAQDFPHFTALIRVFEDVFKMENFQMPDENYLQELLAKDSFFVFVALVEEKVVGGLTAYTLPQYYSQSPLVYIYDLAVQTQWQRQGIGKQLISGIIHYCKEIGAEEVFVQAEEEDVHAVEFYHSTGARAEKVVHFYYL